MNKAITKDGKTLSKKQMFILNVNGVNNISDFTYKKGDNASLRRKYRPIITVTLCLISGPCQNHQEHVKICRRWSVVPPQISPQAVRLL